jgi:hypothetical protein
MENSDVRKGSIPDKRVSTLDKKWETPVKGISLSYFLNYEKQDTGIEPASSAWEADILPMY